MTSICCCRRSRPTPTASRRSRKPPHLKEERPMADETPASEAQPAGAAASAETSLLDDIIAKGKLARDESQKPRAKDLVGEFVHQILDEGMTVSRDTMAMIQAQIARIDELLSLQLNEILHHPDFQKL